MSTNTRVLIDAVVHHTVALIGQIATSGGARPPLAHVAGQVFLDLTREIERQGVSRKVCADMFGMALRAYQKKVQRLTESSTIRATTLWQAVLNFLEHEGTTSRQRVIEHFSRDDEALVRSVLHDLVESGLVVRSGASTAITFRPATKEELHDRVASSPAGIEELVLVTIYREGPLGLPALCQLTGLAELELLGKLHDLAQSGAIVVHDQENGPRFSSSGYFISQDAGQGWQAAVLDHYQAVVKTICRRLQRGSETGTSTAASGSTYSFDVWSGHPHMAEATGMLDEFRARASELRLRIDRYNATHAMPEEYERVDIYFGQSAKLLSRLEEERLEAC